MLKSLLVAFSLPQHRSNKRWLYIGTLAVFQGFLEFSSHAEAKDMVTHYQTKPAFIKGQRISLCLSPTVEVIHVRTLHVDYGHHIHYQLF